jgi:2-dehydropantoate 2-reductase
MKISIVGVGAVGGYFGGKLAKAGLDVTFISRGATLEALQEKGLRIKSYTGDFTIKKPKVAHDFKAIVDSDVVLLCVKSYSTREVAKALKHVISDNTIIVSLQNGIENEDILSEILGTEKIIGSVVFITSSVPEPGLIKHTSYGKIMLGELDGKVTERVRKIEKMFLDAGVPAGITPNIKKELWKKLMLNIPYNGFTSLVRGPLKNYFEIPEAQECFLRALKEVQAVAQMEGYNLTDEDIESALKFTKTDGFTNFKSSTLLDIEAGKPIEIDALQGAVIKAARKYNIDVPINKLIYALLKMSYK